MNIATVGTSMITGEFIKAVKDVAGVQIEAVYSRRQEQAEEFARAHDVPLAFSDLNELARDPRIDCVYIASPNGLHFEQTLLFLQAKKHVICEKPIFSNIAEWEKAYQIAAENGVYLLEAMRNVHMPNFKVLAEDLGKVGKVSSAVLSYASYSARYKDVLRGEDPNIFSLDFSGGALVDIGVYPLTIAIALFGRPLESRYYPVIIPTGVDGSGTLILTYPDFICTILVSKIATTYNPSEIQGELGTFVINNTGTLSDVRFIDIHDGDAVSAVGGEHVLHGMAYEVEVFQQIIESGDEAEYERLKQLSYDVLEITEKVRKENGIIFKGE